jgi:hypothetical protein
MGECNSLFVVKVVFWKANFDRLMLALRAGKANTDTQSKQRAIPT